MTTTKNTKVIIKYLTTIELKDISETRKTSKVRRYTIPTVHLIAEEGNKEGA